MMMIMNDIDFAKATWFDVYMKSDTVYSLIYTRDLKEELLSALKDLTHDVDRVIIARTVCGDTCYFRASGIELIVECSPQGRIRYPELKRYYKDLHKEAFE